VTILVTGATGFVMANLVRHLAEAGHDVVAVDLNPPDAALRQFLGGQRGAVEFHQVDVTDRAGVHALIGGIRPDRAVHGAAITAIPPDAERRRFVETASVNVIGTLNVVSALADAGTRRIVAISSGSVYGRRNDMTPIAEEDGKDPRALYPMTKWAGDMLARRFAEVHGLSLAVARLASPFGPFERDTGSRPLLSPIAYWAGAAIRGESLVVAGDASYERDAIYAPDIASGIATMLLADRLPHDAYNVGWGRGTSAKDTVAAIGRIIPGMKVEWRPDEPSPWFSPTNVPRGPLEIERLRSNLGWRPRFDINSGLTAYIEWLREARRVAS
jgi:dTDP-glucose 4,6-dehydratase